MHDNCEHTNRRLEALERTNRRWRRAAAALAAAAPALLLLGAARPKPRTVEAGEYRLVDEKGTLRASLSSRKATTAFFLADESGTVRARLALDGSARLELSDASGKPRASLALKADGAPELMVGTDKQARAALHVSAEGGAEISLVDSEDHPRAALTLAADGSPRLALYDEEGTLRTALGSTPLKEVRSGSSEMTGPSSLVLLDRKGTVVFKAPK